MTLSNTSFTVYDVFLVHSYIGSFVGVSHIQTHSSWVLGNISELKSPTRIIFFLFNHILTIRSLKE